MKFFKNEFNYSIAQNSSFIYTAVVIYPNDIGVIGHYLKVQQRLKQSVYMYVWLWECRYWCRVDVDADVGVGTGTGACDGVGASAGIGVCAYSIGWEMFTTVVQVQRTR